MKTVVLCVATLWVTTKNAPFSDRNKSFQTFLKTFEIASTIHYLPCLFTAGRSIFWHPINFPHSPGTSHWECNWWNIGRLIPAHNVIFPPNMPVWCLCDFINWIAGLKNNTHSIPARSGRKKRNTHFLCRYIIDPLVFAIVVNHPGHFAYFIQTSTGKNSHHRPMEIKCTQRSAG